MDDFELSLSPYFNDVINNAHLCWTDPTQVVFKDDLAASLKTMAKFGESLSKAFGRAMQVRPKTAFSKTAPQRFESALRHLTHSLHSIAKFLKDDNTDHLPRGVSEGRQAIADMFGLFEEMRTEEESFPVFSKSPYIQEIIRIAAGVGKGEYSSEVLQQKIAWMRQRQQEFSKEFVSLSSSPRENEDVDKLLPLAERALGRMGQALDEMAVYFTDKKRQHLKDGCEQLLKASEVLVVIQDRLLKASEAKPAACPKCSFLNPGGAKTCLECGAAMPEVIGLSTQTLELKENQTSEASYTYLARLQGAVDSFLHNSIGKDELRKHIVFFAGKAKDGKREFEALKFPTEFAEPNEEQAARNAHECLKQGVQYVQQGVAQLEQFLADDNKEHLPEAIEAIKKGANLIADCQQIAHSAQLHA